MSSVAITPSGIIVTPLCGIDVSAAPETPCEEMVWWVLRMHCIDGHLECIRMSSCDSIRHARITSTYLAMAFGLGCNQPQIELRKRAFQIFSLFSIRIPNWPEPISWPRIRRHLKMPSINWNERTHTKYPPPSILFVVGRTISASNRKCKRCRNECVRPPASARGSTIASVMQTSHALVLDMNRLFAGRFASPVPRLH